MKIIFVACVGQKLDQPAQAQDLYQSTWFKKARKYAEAHGDEWRILSARYGLVSPQTVLEPYNQTLSTMMHHERAAWAEKIYRSIRSQWSNEAELIFLAGTYYRLPLVLWLQNAGYTTVIPLAHLGIGQQLAWFDKNT